MLSDAVGQVPSIAKYRTTLGVEEAREQRRGAIRVGNKKRIVHDSDAFTHPSTPSGILSQSWASDVKSVCI